MAAIPDGPYAVGQQIRIKATFALNGTDTDPGSGNVTLKLLDPNGNESTLTALDDGGGAWHYDYLTVAPGGYWQYRWSSVGTVEAAFEGAFYVTPSPF